MCVCVCRRRGSGREAPGRRTWFLVELTASGLRSPFSSVGGANRCTALEGAELKQPGSPVQTVPELLGITYKIMNIYVIILYL